MKFEKPSPEVLKLFEAVAPAPNKNKGIEGRKMFGYPCRFVNGNMFMGMFNDSMILRLSESDRSTFAKLGSKLFEPMPGRVMKEYLVVPKEIMTIESVTMKTWIDKSLNFASSLPPKQKKGVKRKVHSRR